MRPNVFARASRYCSLVRCLLVSGRPVSSGIAGVLAAAAIAFLPGATIHAVVAGFAFTAITMAGFVLNDVHDREKDRLKKVRRPITLGLISPLQAILYATMLVVFALSITPGGSVTRLILAVTVVALISYSFFSHRFAVLKGVYTAGLCCMPLVYAVTVSGARLRVVTLVALAVFILGREMVLDVLDLDADSEFGLRTIPVVLGSSRARSLGIILMLGSSFCSLLLISRTFGFATAGASIISLLLVLLWPGIDLHSRIRWTRLPMVFGALALASTVGF